MRNRGRLTLALASVIVVLVIGAFAYVLHARSQAPNASSLHLKSHFTLVCPRPPYTLSAPGAPTIQPRNNCTPSFTEQDVRDYLARQGVPLFHIEVVGHPTVEQVVFLSIRDLGQQTGDSAWLSNYSADMVVCYVVLRGTFRYAGAPGSGVHTVSTASILFDAHTGNMLVSSAGP
jgi:hypothetical protein